MNKEIGAGTEPTLAEQLGFSQADRVAIVHADDVGMCHAANIGAFEALDNGPATCGSVMVPCAWFAEAARMARDRPDIDLGVHLTLNAEWEAYRWGPVLGRSAVPSLCDADGGLLRTTAETAEKADPLHVEAELRAQIERALEAGIDVTHLDSHMGTCFAPRFAEIYARLAREFELPVFLLRPDLGDLGDRPIELEPLLTAVDNLVEAGWPVLDGFCAASLHFSPGDGTKHNRGRLAALGTGVSYLICHPARGDEEIRVMTDEWHCREFERTFYGGDSGSAVLEELGIRTVGMKPLRDLLRSRPR